MYSINHTEGSQSVIASKTSRIVDFISVFNLFYKPYIPPNENEGVEDFGESSKANFAVFSEESRVPSRLASSVTRKFSSLIRLSIKICNCDILNIKF